MGRLVIGGCVGDESDDDDVCRFIHESLFDCKDGRDKGCQKCHVPNKKTAQYIAADIMLQAKATAKQDPSYEEEQKRWEQNRNMTHKQRRER